MQFMTGGDMAHPLDKRFADLLIDEITKESIEESGRKAMKSVLRSGEIKLFAGARGVGKSLIGTIDASSITTGPIASTVRCPVGGIVSSKNVVEEPSYIAGKAHNGKHEPSPYAPWSQEDLLYCKGVAERYAELAQEMERASQHVEAAVEDPKDMPERWGTW